MREAASRRGHCEGDRKADPRPAFWEVPPSADPRSPSAGPMPWLRATPAPPEGTGQSPTSSSTSLSPSVGSQSVGSASASQRPGAGPALSPRGRRAVAGTGAGPTPAGAEALGRGSASTSVRRHQIRLRRESETRPARLAPVAATPASDPARGACAARSGLGRAGPADGRPSGRAGEAAREAAHWTGRGAHTHLARGDFHDKG